MTPKASQATSRHDEPPAAHPPGSAAPPPSQPEVSTASQRSWRVVPSLSRVELLRLVRDPLVLLSLVLAGVGFWWQVRFDAPVLDRDSVRLAGWLLPVAAATLIAAHGMAARSRRGRAVELHESLPTPPDRRILGELVAVIGPVILAVVLTAAGVVFLATGDPVGRWRWWELAAGPSMVLLAGALGVALAQWLPNRVTPYISVVALAYLQVWAHPQTEWEISGQVGALAPFQQMIFEQPYSWQGRSAGAHIGWLLALTVVLLAVALLRWSRAPWVVVTLVVGVGAASVSGAVAVAAVTDEFPPEVEAHLEGLLDAQGSAEHQPPDGVLTCLQRDAHEVCALVGYEGWIPRWEATLLRIDRVASSDVERIRQSSRWFYAHDHDTVVPTIEWDRGSGTAPAELEFAIQVAVRAMTSAETYPESDDDWHMCSLAGEARGAIALWLATQDAPAVAEELERRVEGARSMVSYEMGEDGSQSVIDEPQELWLGMETTRTSLTVPDGELALAMLALPLDDVRQVVIEDLDRWRDPAVTGADLAAALGLPTPEPVTKIGSWTERCP